MKKKLNSFFIFLKFIIFFNNIIYSLLETETNLLDNIIIFENTNGDIYLAEDYDKTMFIFGTTLSNQEYRIFYGLADISQENENYIFYDKESDKYVPYIKKSIDRTENKEISNAQLSIFKISSITYIILIGTDDSYIEAFNVNTYEEDLNLFSPSEFFMNNIINKGISPLLFSNTYYFFYISSTLKNDDLSKYYISYHSYSFTLSSEDNSKIQYSVINNNILSNIKGDYMSCAGCYLSKFSCFYLDLNNTYQITFFEEISNKLEIYKTIPIYSPSNINDNEFYFLKAIIITLRSTAAYAFYSGEENNIPTLMFKKYTMKTIYEDFSFTDKYENYPFVYLYDYNFNNGINYNDFIVNSVSSDYLDAYFVSTNPNKEYIIIAYLIFYTSTTTSNTELLIKYFTIKLKDYYNSKIFHGFKAINFCASDATNKYLTIAFDFCLLDTCQNLDDNQGNSALFILSYLNKTSDTNIDFIEYAFNNNRKYVIANLTENFIINNNIFNYYFYEISISDMIDDSIIYEAEDKDGIVYYLENDGSLLDTYFFSAENALRIDLTNYDFEKPDYEVIYIKYNVRINPESDLTKFNSYWDKYNDTFGNIDDENSYKFSLRKSISSYFNISINESLTSINCSNVNCNLCLRRDLNYCIVCQGDNYEIINDENSKFGKLKLCKMIENSEIITEITQMSEITEKLSEISDIVSTIPTTQIINTEITEITEKLSEISDMVSTVPTTQIINTEIPEITEKLSEIRDVVSTITITQLINTEITEKFSETHDIESTIYKTQLINTELTYINESTYIDVETSTSHISEARNNSIFEDVMNNEYIDLDLSYEEIKDIYEEIKNYIKENYDGKEIIINTNNVKIQISNLDELKNSKNLSNIDLGECGEELKSKYCKTENDSLVVIKFDIKKENENSTYVGFELYEPYLKTKINLSECSQDFFFMDIPIELKPDIELLYDLLSKAGYDLFNENSSFYNDICATYTTENGTDILLYDRRMDIYQSTINISLCQDGCNFQSYEKDSKKAKCQCSIQSESESINELDLSEIKFDKNEMIDKFTEVIDNSNFRVLKCYNLLFKFNLFIKNIGSIIMSVLLLIFIGLIIAYKFFSYRKLHLYISEIIRYKSEINNKNKVGNKGKKIHEKNHKNKKRRKKSIKSKYFHSKKDINDEKMIHNKNTLMNTNTKKEPPKKSNKSVKVNANKLGSFINSKQPIHKMSININNYFDLNKDSKSKNKRHKNKNKTHNNDNNIKISTKRKTSRMNSSLTKEKNLNKKYSEEREINLDESIYNTKKLMKHNFENKLYVEKKEDNIKLNVLNDQEMNSLDYQKAIELDKRTYWQYYLSLIKKKQLILFTFFLKNDYNLLTIKISLFLVSFSLYLTINGFFFNDKTMHKIYEDSGTYNFLYQLPQIFYSSVTSSIINIILKTLSLSEKDILKIKQETNKESSTKRAKEVEKCIKIKFFLFFIISFILMLFFWYFISCFCAVYKNTQLILFKDTLLSFGLSMLYPFGINIFPGFFRIPALRAKNKDKKCLYKFGQILALL